MLKSLITSKSLMYVILRYVTYALTFVNTLLLAKFLGGFEYGVYSFILLVMSYMTYSNLGMNESLNTEYAKFKHRKISKYIWDTAWSLNIIISVAGVLVFGGIYLFDRNLFSEYKFGEYALLVILTCGVINLARIFITFYKLYGKLIKLNIQQLLPNITIFVLIIILNSRITIMEIVWALFLTNLISLIIFRIGLPVEPRFFISFKLARTLLLRGVSLLMYNFSYSLFILLASSIISMKFTVTEFGCFSLSNSIANGVIMAGGAFLFIFYPRILNAMTRPKAECLNMINKIRSVYVIGINIICILSIPLVFVLSFFYPQYSISMVRIFSILMIGKCINNSMSGYSAYLIANKKERLMTVYALISVAVEWVIIEILLALDLGMDYIVLGIVFGSMIYTSLIVIEGLKGLKGYCNVREWSKEIFSSGNWLALLILVVYSFIWTNMYFLVVAFVCFYLIERQVINRAIKNGLSIIGNKNSLNF